jgi:fructose-1,6-bisphosphatase/inositol monophosphatase family enzyme
MAPSIDPERVTDIMRAVAAAAIMPRFNKLAAGDIRHKGGKGDFATIADLDSERALSAQLTALLPGSIAVGEEGIAQDARLLDLIGASSGGARAGSDGKPVWVIDPLDGTHNFANGVAHFCVIVALVKDSDVVGGWVHDPVADATIAAERGAGSWEAGVRRKVAPPTALDAMQGAIYSRADLPGVAAGLAELKRRYGNGGDRRCAGHEYLDLARGRSHFAMFSRLLPWDHAAGALIHREAGGYNACWDGTPYRPTRHEGGLLLAPDRPSWDALAGLLLARA